MRIPVDKLAGVFKAGVTAKHESDTPVRVTVLVDTTATPFLIDAVKGALVPQTTAALVRVGRIGEAPVEVKHDTDITVVLTSGSPRLQSAVQEAVIAGAPTVVLSESSVEVPFITEDTPMLGLISATDRGYLLEELARWILDHTEKGPAFASNFPFMRSAAGNRVIVSTALANMATGALVFIPGANYPVMAAAQLGMLSQLAAIYDKPLRAERGYEVAGVLASGLVLRALAKGLASVSGRGGFAVKALVGGIGTYAMGQALSHVYESDVDYSRANEVLGRVFALGRDAVLSVMGGEGGVRDDAAEASAGMGAA